MYSFFLPLVTSGDLRGQNNFEVAYFFFKKDHIVPHYDLLEQELHRKQFNFTGKIGSWGKCLTSGDLR